MRGDGEKPRPVSDMWQAIQIGQRVHSNEQGVTKVRRAPWQRTAQGGQIKGSMEGEGQPGCKGPAQGVSRLEGRV